MMLVIKKFWQRQHRRSALESQLDFIDIKKIITKEKSYQAFRLEKLEENFNKKSEDLLDHVFNKSVILNQKLRELQEKQSKQLQKLNQPLETLKTKYENLEISEADYERQTKLLRAQLIAEKKSLEKQHASLIKEKKSKIHNLLEAQKAKAQKRQMNLKKQHQKLVDKVHNDLNKNLQLLAQNYESHQKIINTAQAKAQKNYQAANQYLQLEQKKFQQSLEARQLAKKEFLRKERHLESWYLQTVKKLKNSYHQQLKPFTKVQKKINLSRLYERERLKGHLRKFKNGIFDSKLVLFFTFYAFIVGFQSLDLSAANFSLGFFSPRNWSGSIIFSNIFIGFLAIGETFPILLGGIDLSVGSMMGFTAVVYMVFSVQLAFNPLVALVMAFIAGAGLGFLQGFIISRFKIPPFIVTLAGLLTLRGAVTIITAGSPITILGDSDFLINFFAQKIGGVQGINVISIFFIVIAFIVIFLIKITKFGRYLYATGDNENAARLSGIKTKNIITAAYLISGMMATFAALAFLANIRSVAPLSGTANELDAITAVVLGGTALTGGKGGVFKTLIGWFSLSLAINAFAFQGLNFNVQLVVKGSIIVIAVILDKKYAIIKHLRTYYYRYLYKI